MTCRKYRAFLALGSNLGDRRQYLDKAMEEIGKVPDTAVSAVSAVYETRPVGYLEQGAFLNMAAEIDTSLEPKELLHCLQAIETRLGRTREIRWGPRTLDIDILLFEGKVTDTDDPELILPHPRMHERAFMLIPLRDIFPAAILHGKPIGEWISRCEDRDGVKRLE